MGKETSLSDIFRIEHDINKYYLHFATGAFDVFVGHQDRWVKGWNANGDRNRKAFTREYIISFVNYGHNEWLFGGIIRRVNEEGIEDPVLTDMYGDLIGRLIVKFKKGRSPYLKLTSKLFEEIKIKQILDSPIRSKQFTSYENVHLSFEELKNIVDKNITQWMEKLSFIQGIYLIFDNKSKKMYIGKADGSCGIWERWSCYANSNGTGYNDKLVELIKNNGIDYAQHFEFTLLEYAYKGQVKDKGYFDKRENYWKEVFHSRVEDLGLNAN